MFPDLMYGKQKSRDLNLFSKIQGKYLNSKTITHNDDSLSVWKSHLGTKTPLPI